MMNSEDERHKVAKRLRALPTDLYSTLCEWEEQGFYVDGSKQDEADYSLIHNVLFGCFPAEHMHPCDYEKLHERLAGLIDPTCEVEPMPDCVPHHRFSRWMCGKCGLVSFTPSNATGPSYCPNCGARVVNSDDAD